MIEYGQRLLVVSGVVSFGETLDNCNELRARGNTACLLRHPRCTGGNPQRPRQRALALRPLARGREGAICSVELAPTMQQDALYAQHFGNTPPLIVLIGACDRLLDDGHRLIAPPGKTERSGVLAEKV